jgi:hypothetical protein
LNVVVTHHALKRFRQRFPAIVAGLTWASSKDLLLVLMAEAVELKPPLLWRYVADRQFWEDCEYYHHPEVPVVFAMKPGELDTDEGLVCVTCLPKVENRPPRTGDRKGGAKHRGRQRLRMEGGYKRKRFVTGDDEQ